MLKSFNPGRVKEVSEKPKFVYLTSLILIGLIWVIGLIFAALIPPSSLPPKIDYLHSFIFMVIVLLVVTVFSFAPALFYAIFNAWGKERGEENTRAELRHINPALLEEFEAEIKEASLQAYDSRAYPVPVLLTTFSMIVGWALFFFSEGPNYIYGIMRSGNVSYIFSNIGESHPIVFGFLGVFFWSLGTLFNRYVRGDLKATVFTHITVRVWTVFVLTMVLAAVWTGYDQFWIIGGENLKSVPPKTLIAASFMVGIFPDIGLDLIKKVLIVQGIFRKQSEQELNFNRIRGLSLWDQGRLEEEGIQNVQNLAKSDVIRLIVNTRLSIRTLLDWVDQALLIVHGLKTAELLQASDISTATDLEAIYAGCISQRLIDEAAEGPCNRVTYLGCEGITRIPQPPDSLIEGLLKNDKDNAYDLKWRLHSVMVSICDDVNYHRLWQLQHEKLPGG